MIINEIIVLIPLKTRGINITIRLIIKTLCATANLWKMPGLPLKYDE